MFRPSSVVLLALAVSACGHGVPPSKPAASASAVPRVAPAALAPPAPGYGATAIDTALREAWRRAGVTPAPRSDDATFLRRAYVDIVGNVPPLEVTQHFLADTAPDKRAKLVDTLLASPAYADHWMTYWDDILMGQQPKGGNLVDRAAFRGWLRERFAASDPWDRIVTDLVAATGQNGLGGKKKGALLELQGGAPPEPHGEEPESTERDTTINGAVNWTLRYEQSPQDLGGTASRVFLGVQIQCAQCHDHKTESWKQDDFRKFASAFFHARVAPIDRGKPMGIRRVDLVDSKAVPPRFVKSQELLPIAAAKPTALDGKDLDDGIATRKTLARWMTAKDNPWFAKAFVNRMWGHFLGRGFVDPVDDIRPSNPATAPAVLDALAADFAAHDYDIKRLVRAICATEAYGVAASAVPANAKTDPENKLWARFHLVPLGPEELLNAVLRVTDLEDTAQKAGVVNLDALRAAVVQRYAFLFDTDEDDDEPDYSGTISQALALLNGALVAQGDRALPGSTVADIVRAAGTDSAKVDLLALRVLGRAPTTDERTRWVAYVDGKTEAAAGGRGGRIALKGERTPLARLGRRAENVSPKEAAYEDLVWTFLNSSEFTFNH